MRKEDKEALCDDFDGFRVDYANISYMSVTATLDYLSEMTRVMRALGYGPEDVGCEDAGRAKAAKRYARLHDKVAKDCQRFFNSLASLHSFSAQVKRKIARGRASLKSENRYVSLSEWRSLAEKLGEFDDSEAMIKAILSVYDLNDPSHIDSLPEKERDFVREFAASLKPEEGPRKAEKLEGAKSEPAQKPEEPLMVAFENIPLSDDDAPVFDNEPGGEVSFKNEIELEPVNYADIEDKDNAPCKNSGELCGKGKSANDERDEVIEDVGQEDDSEEGSDEENFSEDDSNDNAEDAEGNDDLQEPVEEERGFSEEIEESVEPDEDDPGDPDEGEDDPEDSDVDIDEDDPDEDDIKIKINPEDSFENPENLDKDDEDVETDEDDIVPVDIDEIDEDDENWDDEDSDNDFDDPLIDIDIDIESMEDDKNRDEGIDEGSEDIVFQDDEDPDFSAQVDAAYEALNDDDDDEDDDDWEEDQ